MLPAVTQVHPLQVDSLPHISFLFGWSGSDLRSPTGVWPWDTACWPVQGHRPLGGPSPKANQAIGGKVTSVLKKRGQAQPGVYTRPWSAGKKLPESQGTAGNQQECMTCKHVVGLLGVKWKITARFELKRNVNTELEDPNVTDTLESHHAKRHSHNNWMMGMSHEIGSHQLALA